MKKHVGYVSAVTEFELGWGCRPDGYILCMDKAQGIAFAQRDKGHVWCMGDGSEFSTAGEFKLIVLTEEGYDYLDQFERKLAWINNSELFDYVEKD